MVGSACNGTNANPRRREVRASVEEVFVHTIWHVLGQLVGQVEHFPTICDHSQDAPFRTQARDTHPSRVLDNGQGSFIFYSPTVQVADFPGVHCGCVAIGRSRGSPIWMVMMTRHILRHLGPGDDDQRL